MINRLLLISLLLGGVGSVRASDVNAGLQTRAEEFVRDQLSLPLDARAQISAASIDERLQLSACDQDLEISLPARMEIRRNTTLYLQCHETPGWDLYLPVRVSIQKPYITVVEAIAKGDILGRNQLVRAYEDQTLIRGDYVQDLEALVGTRSKRELRPGQPVRLNQICVVCKGDQVTLIAENSSMQIKTMARALQDGSFGDMIKLINTRSGKTVQGKVSSVDTVIVTF